MRVVRSDGRVLDATFSVHGGPSEWTLIYESSGGRAGGPNPRNLDYRAGLSVLFQRLADERAELREIRVDTERTSAMSIEQRRIEPAGFPFPIHAAQVDDIARLRRSISAAARKVGQSPERAARRGGSSRRLALVFRIPESVEPEVLVVRLAGAGGAAEVDEISSLVELAAGRARSGQGFLVSQALRDALERHAVALAMDAYRDDGWNPEYVGDHESYDIRCRRGDDELRVEVKGTTTAGDTVLLTPNEVRYAREHYPNVDLFVVFGIHVEAVSMCASPSVGGGRIKRVRRWDVEERDLRAVGYQYRIPSDRAGS